MIETGVDIVEIERVRAAIERHGRRFLERVFTDIEQQQCRDSAQSLAGRFAAKEAAFKALGARFGWRDIEVRTAPGGKPSLALHGRALQQARDVGLREWAVSISHSRDNAVAVVVALGDAS